MTKSILLVLALMMSVALLQTGCASAGTRIDVSQISRIEKGKTTKSDLVQMFGSPLSVSLMGDGREMMMWSYSKAQVKGATFIPVVGMMAGGTDVQMTTFQVILNKDKVVEDFTHNEGNIESRMGR